MAEIQEYLPQVSSPEPVGGVSPNIELAGAVGRSAQNLGGTLEQAGAALHQRQSQRESADVYSNTAQARADNFQSMDSGLQDGSFDKDKFFEKFDKDSADYGSTLTTPEAKNYFERQNARLRGSLLKHATLGEAQIASREAVGNLVSARNANSQTIFNHPDQFDDINESMLEHADQLSGVGAIPAKMKDKLFQDTSREYAVSAVLGTAEINPNAARVLLKDQKFSTYFSTEQREALVHKIDQAEHEKSVEKDRVFTQHQRAMTTSEEAFYSKNFDNITSGQTPVDDIVKAVNSGKIRGKFGTELVGIIDRASQKDLKTKPDSYQEALERILDPSSTNPITSFDQVNPYVINGDIATDGPHSIKQLKWAWDNLSPQGKATKQNMSGLLREAKAAIMYPDTQGGKGPDAYSVGKYNDFISDLTKKMKDATAAGQDPNDLLDRTKPTSYLGGDKLKDYITPITDRYKKHYQMRTDKAIGMAPTGSDPNPTPNPRARKPNESISDWEKRMAK